MTETEWLTGNDLDAMLEYLEELDVAPLEEAPPVLELPREPVRRPKPTDRKFRLFCAACCRRVWPLLQDLRSRNAVEILERYADGLATDAQWFAGHSSAYDVMAELGEPLTEQDWAAETVLWALDDSDPYYAARDTTDGACNALGQESAVLADLLRDIFGNPFHPVAVDATLLGGGAISHLAQAIYNEQAFERMPILADALEEVGCSNDVVLAHCRGDAIHVRGCWLLDLLLAKELTNRS